VEKKRKQRSGTVKSVNSTGEVEFVGTKVKGKYWPANRFEKQKEPSVSRAQVVGRAAYNNGQAGTGAVQIPETPAEQNSRLTEVIKSGEAAETPLARVLKIIPPHILAQIDQEKVIADALSHASPVSAPKSIGGLPSHSIRKHTARRPAPKKGQPTAPTGAVGARRAPPRTRRQTTAKQSPTATQYAQALQEEKARLQQQAAQGNAVQAHNYAVAQHMVAHAERVMAVQRVFQHNQHLVAQQQAASQQNTIADMQRKLDDRLAR
jgi:hypothetical protein